MNKAMFIGRLTKDVELTTTTSGISVAKFSIAVDRKFKNASGEKETDFFNCVAWRKLGEIIVQYCKKGSQIFISGEVQNRSYEAKDGTKRYITEIIADDCQFLDSKKDNNGEVVKEEKEKQELTPVPDDQLPF